ncbi:hypothetical protein IE53DRAFT_372041 [Violaceomyces palustris]|uniref:Uncharacterized protein n=1 Tax=Violaceomyces palustris TaxID=1673888 RepID=A0ACD0NLR6_9BASI|nr:hypothetical protein IE53DRAFT_372041 [Violaceomyces palustris]
MKFSLIVASVLALAVTLPARGSLLPDDFFDLEARDSVIPSRVQPVLRQAQSPVPDTLYERAPQAYPSNYPYPTDGKPNGKSCTASYQCKSDYCHHKVCDVKKGNGHVCYKDQGCISGNCRNKRCVPADGTGVIGSNCNLSTQCSTGLYCRRGSCDTKKPAGHVCYKDNGCVSGSCVNKRCIADGSLPIGDKCSKSVQCGTGNCSRARCANRVANGQFCYKNVNCQSLSCVNSLCVA